MLLVRLALLWEKWSRNYQVSLCAWFLFILPYLLKNNAQCTLSSPSLPSLSLSYSTPPLSPSVTAVDGVVANQLVKLGDKYPVLTREPAEVRIHFKNITQNRLG